MSLQVWLPLTKDLRNQGLSDVTVANNGATFNSAGKLGGCYSFGTGASGMTLPASVMNNFTEGSVAFWIKLNSWNTNYATFFQAGTGSTPWNNYIFGVLRNGSNSTVCFTIGNGSSASNNSYLTSAWETGVWFHMAFTYEAGKCKIYKNGKLDKEYTTTIVPDFTKISKISIGRSNADSSYQTHCDMSDFRIYDHCLSPMEVKELAKGLVLHYPLNRQGWGQENLLLNTNDLTKWPKESACTITLENDGYYHVVSTNTNGNRYGIYYDLTFPEVGTYTLSADVRTDWRIGFAASSGFGWTANTITGTGNAQHIIKTITTTSENNKCRIYINSQMNSSGVVTNSTYVKNIKVEKGSIATSWSPAPSDTLADVMGLNSNIEYDTSGFNNNGTKVGTLTYTSDTPKYEVSTIFPENPANYIVTTGLKQQVFTWACWFKVLGAVEKSYQFILSEGRDMGSVGTNICTTKAGTGLYLDSHGIRSSTANISLNEWYHVALVCDDSQMSFYLNGQLIGSKAYTAETDYAQSNDAFVIGKMAHAYTNTTVYFPFNGQISDVRIYATALSADDVKSLYQNSAYIDSNGNVYGAVHSEV